MNKNIIEFVLVFCLISVAVSVVLVVVNASTTPVATGAVTVFAITGVVFAVAAYYLNQKRVEANDNDN